MILALLALIAPGLGWWAHQTWRQASAVALIAKYPPAQLRYEGRGYVGFPDDRTFAAKEEGDSWWPPAALERWFGLDPFRHLVEVRLGHDWGAGGPSEDELIAAVVRLRRLKILAIEFDVSDAQAERLAQLPALEDLDLPQSNEGLTDRGMRAIGALKTLKSLRVNHTNITPAGLASLGGLGRLESLYMASMRFEGNAEGGEVRAASNTDWSTGIAPLAGLANLTRLELAMPILSGGGLEHLGRIKSLKMLEIDGLSCPDDDLRHLASLANLQVIGLSETTIDGSGFRHLGGLSGLAYVILQRTPRLTDRAIPTLAGLPALEMAMLDGSTLTADGLGAFRAAPKLRFLWVNPPAVGDAGRLREALPLCRVQNGQGDMPGDALGATSIGFAIEIK